MTTLATTTLATTTLATSTLPSRFRRRPRSRGRGLVTYQVLKKEGSGSRVATCEGSCVVRSRLAGREVARAVPAILTRLCPSSRCSLFFLYLLGRVARCFLADACCLAARRLAGALAHSSARPIEGSGRAPRAPPRPATEPAVWSACRAHGASHDGQATSNGGQAKGTLTRAAGA